METQYHSDLISIIPDFKNTLRHLALIVGHFALFLFLLELVPWQDLMGTNHTFMLGSILFQQKHI